MHFKLTVSALMIAACFNTVRCAELTADEKAAGWFYLFDGKSTEEWRGWNATDFPQKGWVVEEGCLKCEKSNGRPNGGGGDLVTKKEFTDYELSWEWKISKGGNSGVKYFIRKRGAGATPLYSGDKGEDYAGHEYQLLDDENHPDAKNGPIRMTGSFYAVLQPQDKKLNPAGQFNTSRLLVRGNHVEHWLNEQKILEYDLGSNDVLNAVAKTKYKSIPGFGTKMKSAILLQDHGLEIAFRTIKIRPLLETK